jgi:hypothetical protein
MRKIPTWALLAAGIAMAAPPVTARPAKKAAKAPVPAKKKAGTPAPAAAKTESGGPKVGQKAPDFTLLGADEKNHTLSDYRGRWVVLNFYPADFTKG